MLGEAVRRLVEAYQPLRCTVRLGGAGGWRSGQRLRPDDRGGGRGAGGADRFEDGVSGAPGSGDGKGHRGLEQDEFDKRIAGSEAWETLGDAAESNGVAHRRSELGKNDPTLLAWG